MKRQLERPSLTDDDIDDLRIVCGYYGYTLYITDKQQIVASMEDAAYIQKDNVRGVYLVWRKTERVQVVNHLLKFTKEIMDHDIIPLDEKDFNKSFINGLSSMLRWKKGKTLNSMTDGKS